MWGSTRHSRSRGSDRSSCLQEESRASCAHRGAPRWRLCRWGLNKPNPVLKEQHLLNLRNSNTNLLKAQDLANAPLWAGCHREGLEMLLIPFSMLEFFLIPELWSTWNWSCCYRAVLQGRESPTDFLRLERESSPKQCLVPLDGTLSPEQEIFILHCGSLGEALLNSPLESIAKWCKWGQQQQDSNRICVTVQIMNHGEWRQLISMSRVWEEGGR